MSLVVGIDVGGTNTDVVIIHGSEVIGWSKSATTENILDGVVNATQSALDSASSIDKNVITNIKRVHIGTTHFINAVIKRKGLSKVACIRLCGQASLSLPPFTDFPKDLSEIVNGGSHMLKGGFEFDGSVISDVDTDEITEVIKTIATEGINHVAVSGIFSPTNPCQENLIGDMLQKLSPDITYTLSHQLGHLGLLERENASILNESLKVLCKKTITGFKRALNKLGLHCPVFFTQNDGTLISEQRILNYPVFTFSSGATNSMRGAAHLSSLKDAIIVDIGGTSTDVGVLKNGFPREASSRIKIGGVNTNFHMPDVKSIGLGGGSLVKVHEDQSVSVGPKSVEYNITRDAVVFGGDVLVSTDIAVACGIADVGDKANVANLNDELKEKALHVIKKMVEDTVDSVKLNDELCPVVLVGGGSILIDCNETFAGASSIIKPSNYQVANAVGAALSKVSGSIDKLVTMTDSTSRDEVLESAKKEAISVAVSNGAIEESCNIVNISEVKMAYMAVPCFRLQVKAVGELEVLDKSHKTVHQMPAMETQTLADPSRNIKKNGKKDKDVSDVVQKQTETPLYHNPLVTDKGEWVLNLWDADCIAIGAGILGCGGGGSPYLGRLRLRTCIEKGLQVKVIHPSSLQENQKAFSVAFMGAPEILIERLTSDREIKDAIKILQKLFEVGVADTCIEQIAKDNDWKLENVDGKNCKVMKLPQAETLESLPAAIFPCEIGGLNAIEPLVLAGELGIPVLDCDGMGRAFPKLQHFGPFILGSSCCPSVIADYKGNHACCVKCDCASTLEDVFRKYCIQMGCAAGVALGGLSKDEISSKTCLFTISKAWYLGNAVLISREQHKSPIHAIVEKANGKVLGQGKICDLYRETKDGFTWGKVKIEGSGPFAGKNMAVDFQNEFIIAKSLDSDEILATVPDLITVVDTDSGEPITTDELKYGLRVTVLVLSSMPLMCTEKALEFVSPTAFGYPDIEYKAACEFIPVQPIPKDSTK